MTNTITKIENNTKQNFELLFNDIYLFPNWEKVGECALTKKRLFSSKTVELQLYRKFSPKNVIEKYSLRINDSQAVAFMDLKVYKDCVYVINLDSDSHSLFQDAIINLMQIAIEKAVLDTTHKEVRMNLSYPLMKKNKIKRVLKRIGFVEEKEQNQYEKEIFGETMFLKAEISTLWNSNTRQRSFFINK